jgi:DNA-directed RNA polymerase specialized sigma24 family protein
MEEPCFAPPEPSLADLYTEAVPWLRQYVQRHFPRVCTSICEDAVQDAFVAALEHPERFTAAYQQGGMLRVEGLCRTIAWRAARGRLVRSSSRFELGGEALTWCNAIQPPGQELLVDAALHLDGLIDGAVARHAPASAERVRAAVVDRMLGGGTDTAVALRHGVRREYINRSRRDVERQLWGAA